MVGQWLFRDFVIYQQKNIFCDPANLHPNWSGLMLKSDTETLTCTFALFFILWSLSAWICHTGKHMITCRSGSETHPHLWPFCSEWQSGFLNEPSQPASDLHFNLNTEGGKNLWSQCHCSTPAITLVTPASQKQPRGSPGHGLHHVTSSFSALVLAFV